MLRIRSFANTDPPELVGVWRSRGRQPGLLQPVSADLFEQYVFAKLYFDYRGLVVAEDQGKIIGFAHAGFGPNTSGTGLSAERGVVCLVLVRPEYEASEAGAGLLAACEAYLAARGATQYQGGGLRPLAPFYLGLYGSSELPGVLVSDEFAQRLFHTNGYEVAATTRVFRRDLNGFQAPFDRTQMQLRRQMAVEIVGDAPTQSWWDACTLGDFDLIRFDAKPRGGSVLARALFRSMDLPGAGGFVRAAGLLDVEVDPHHRHEGLATYLLSESFAALHRQGVMAVEGQISAADTIAAGLFARLGFVQFDEGTLFRKTP